MQAIRKIETVAPAHERMRDALIAHCGGDAGSALDVASALLVDALFASADEWQRARDKARSIIREACA